MHAQQVQRALHLLSAVLEQLWHDGIGACCLAVREAFDASTHLQQSDGLLQRAFRRLFARCQGALAGLLLLDSLLLLHAILDVRAEGHIEAWIVGHISREVLNAIPNSKRSG